MRKKYPKEKYPALNARIATFRKSQNLTQLEFSKILQIDKQRISKWENDQASPQTDFFVKIAQNFPQLNLRWLLTGEGEPILDKAEMEVLNPTSLASKDPLVRILVGEIERLKGLYEGD